MNNIIYRPPRAQHFDVDGTPLDNGRLIFYANKTTTLKAIYSGLDKTTPAPNPHVLDMGGFVQNGGIWLAEGLYTVVVQKDDGAGGWETLYEFDDIAGSDFYSSQNLNTIETIQGLRDSLTENTVYIEGYNSRGDNGGGWFYWDGNSTIADDGGSYISRTGGGIGRYVRLFNDDHIRPEQWGGIPDDSELNVTSNFQSMIAFASNTGKSISVGNGDYYLGGDVNFVGSFKVVVEENVRFLGSGTVTFGVGPLDKIIDVEIRGSKQKIQYPDTNLVNNSRQESYPEWWGANSFADASLLIQEADDNTASGLILDSQFQVGGVTLVNDLRFTGGSIIADVGTVSIGGELSGEIKFRGELSEYTFPNRNDFKSSWFLDSGSIDVTQYTNLITALTTSGRIELEWNDEHTFASNYTDSANEQVDNYFTSVLTINATVNFGKIISDSKAIFNSESTGTVVLFDGDLDMSWFGALRVDDNKPFEFALRSLQTGQWLDFAGHPFTSTVAVAVTNDVRVRNGDLVGQLSITGDAEFKDFTVDGLTFVSGACSANRCAFRNASGTVLSVGGESLVLNDVSLDPVAQTSATAISATNTLIVRLNKVVCNTSSLNAVEVSTGDQSGVFYRSSITNCNFDLLSVRSQVVGTTSGMNCLIDGNTFNTILGLYNPENIQVTNNYFHNGYSNNRVILYATSASYTCLGLSMKNNFFDYGYGPYSGAVISLQTDGGTWASTGHRCFIGENDTNANGGAYTIEGTQLVAQRTFSGTNPDNFPVPANKIILPYDVFSLKGRVDFGNILASSYIISGGYVTSGTITMNISIVSGVFPFEIDSSFVNLGATL